VTIGIFLALALAGGAGAALRLLVDGLVRARTKLLYPVGTTIINVSGSLVLGLLTGFALGNALAIEWQLVLGTGLIGGYTTFSTASFESVRLVQQRRIGLALINGFGMLILAVAAAALGIWVGKAI